LFRLTIARGRTLSKLPSWSVAKTSWPAVRGRIIKTAQRVGIETACGQWTIGLAKGDWELKDNFGLVLFASNPGATGCAAPRPSVTLQLQEEETIFGLGESTGTFNKRGLVREFWNIDVGGHADAVHPTLPNMYISIPFALSLRHGRAAGLFWDNPS